MRKICRHHGRRAAKEPERIRHHAFVTLRQEFFDPPGVGLGENGDGVPVVGAVQLGMSLARDALSQFSAVLVSVCATLQSNSHGDNP
jgi:hypothetical protein